MNESQVRLKRGKPVGSKDKNPRTKKGAKKLDDQVEDIEIPKDSSDIINDSVLEEPQVPEIVKSEEILKNYVIDGIQWNRSEVNVDDVFAYNIALNVINDTENQ